LRNQRPDSGDHEDSGIDPSNSRLKFTADPAEKGQRCMNYPSRNHRTFSGNGARPRHRQIRTISPAAPAHEIRIMTARIMFAFRLLTGSGHSLSSIRIEQTKPRFGAVGTNGANEPTAPRP
jgi:hypothetical protein